MEYLAKKDKNGIYMLSINGVPSICPFTPPFVAQGKFGMEVQRLGCSSQCPHFRMDGKGVSSYKLEFGCGKGDAVDLTVEEEKKPPSLVIS